MDYWEARVLAVGQCTLWELGPVCLWLKRVSDEFHLAIRRDPTQELRAGLRRQADPPVDLEWQRFAAGASAEALRLLPVMSLRPVVVRPESPFTIPSTTQAMFYVNIPLWFRIESLRAKPVELTTIPSVDLPFSWFGTLTEGELCYALRTSARRALADAPTRVHRAICQVKIRNRSSKPLTFQHICIVTAHLSIFQAAARLWTNPISLTYQGDALEESVVYGKRPTEQAGEVTLLTPASESPSHRLWRRSLDTFVKLGLR